jgi:hypothetical protein
MELKIANRNVIVDTEKLSKGIYQLHVDEGCLTPLKFGLLDAKIMETLERQLTERFREEWKGHYEVHSEQINLFHKAVVKEITVGIYKNTKMIV